MAKTFSNPTHAVVITSHGGFSVLDAAGDLQAALVADPAGFGEAVRGWLDGQLSAAVTLESVTFGGTWVEDVA